MGARGKKFLSSLTILLILAGVPAFLLAAVPAFAGPVSITGTARCHMPDLLEMEARPIARGRDARAPDAVASSGPIEVKKEERAEATEEEVMILQARTDSDQSVTVYTICAR